MSVQETFDKIIMAELAARNGDTAQACRLYREAAEMQRSLVNALPDGLVNTKSLYGFSVASLLFKAGDFDEAEAYAVELLEQRAPVGEEAALQDVIDLVALYEATTLIELYERNPKRYPQGRSAELARVAGYKLAKGRYKKGPNQEVKCTLCRGPALPCAIRHATGRSCA